MDTVKADGRNLARVLIDHEPWDEYVDHLPTRRELVNRCLSRLGSSQSLLVPEVFIENELALCLRRFGFWRVVRAMIRQRWDIWCDHYYQYISSDRASDGY